jgi:ribosome biogenesis GTPase
LNQQALVRVSYGSQGVVELQDGRHLRCKYRRSVGRPYCGDQVMIEDAGHHSTVVSAILPRRNVFMRADARQRKQVIAANLDQVLVVVTPRPEPSRDLVERYLVAVHSLGIKPVIVLNKVELMATAVLSEDSPLFNLDDYRELGYQVLETSCKTAPGIAALESVLHDCTSILVGQSGVGKSSLANSLIPDLELQTGELSRVTGKGTHTTTTTIMYSLPGGGRLIDSPGVWEYGLWQMEHDDLTHGFIEFAPFLGHCKFNDCRHDSEPQCAVQAAVEAGNLEARRYQSYLRLLQQSG